MLWRRYASDDLRHDLFDQFIATHGLIPFGKIFSTSVCGRGNNVYGFYFADVTRSCGTRVCCRFYRPDITTNDDGHQPGTYFS